MLVQQGRRIRGGRGTQASRAATSQALGLLLPSPHMPSSAQLHVVGGRSLDAPERQTCQTSPLGNGETQPQAWIEAPGPEAEAQADTLEQLPAQEAGPPVQVSVHPRGLWGGLCSQRRTTGLRAQLPVQPWAGGRLGFP